MARRGRSIRPGRAPPTRSPRWRTDRPAACARQRSRSAFRSSGLNELTCAPAGPTPRVNGSHHSSKLACVDVHGQRSALDPAEAGGLEQLRQVTFTNARQLGFVGRVGVELARGVPEDVQRTVPAGVVPDAGRDDPFRPRHPTHLGQATDRIAHEVHDELRKHGIERVVRERQLLGGGPPDVDARVASARGRHERLRRVDGRDSSRSQPPDKLTGQCAGPGTDVQRAHPVAHPGEIGEEGRQRGRVPPHERVVRAWRRHRSSPRRPTRLPPTTTPSPGAARPRAGPPRPSTSTRGGCARRRARGRGRDRRPGRRETRRPRHGRRPGRRGRCRPFAQAEPQEEAAVRRRELDVVTRELVERRRQSVSTLRRYSARIASTWSSNAPPAMYW